MPGARLRQWGRFAGLLLACLVAGRSNAGDPFKALGVIRPQTVQPAPAFRLTGFDGREFSLKGSRGHVVLLTFWASWCLSCKDELPAMTELWQRYHSQGLDVIGVSIDHVESEARNYADRLQAGFPMAFDSGGNLSRRYEVRGVPTSYLIDRDGRFIGLIIGERDWRSPAARQFIEALLQGDLGSD